MNFAQRLMEQGRAMLAKQSPQATEFTFDGVKTLANCNHNQNDPGLVGIIDATLESGSIIEWPLTGSIPRQGDSLIEANGSVHAVRKSYHIGHAIKLVCAVISA